MSAVGNQVQRHRLSVTDFHRMAEAGILRPGERVELIEGEIIDMAPIGSAHGGAVKLLANRLKLAVGERAVVSVQDPVVLDAHSEPQPDVALLRPREDFYAASHPRAQDVLLVVEVAEASLPYDREVKPPLYARHGIPEAWLVDLASRQFLMHRAPTAKGYGEVLPMTLFEALPVPGLEPLRVDLRGLF